MNDFKRINDQFGHHK
ncbi:MAG: hypothetical protein ACOZBL_01640 [Patescibacteria group bacterium]